MKSLQFSKYFSAVIRIGIGDLKDQAKEQRILMVNSLSFTLGIMTALFGLIFYYLSGQLEILIPALFESMLAFWGLYLNYLNKHDRAALHTYFVQCGAALYFGLVLGKVISLDAMTIFLMLIAYRLFKNEFVRTVCVATAIIILIAIETGNFLHFPYAIELSPSNFHIFKFLAVAGVVMLAMIIGRPYAVSNDQLILSNFFKQLFVSKICHELRTILNNISLSANLLKLEIEKDGSLRKIEPLVDMLLLSVNAAEKVVNSVLSMSMIESGKTDPVELESYLVSGYFEKMVEMNLIAAAVRNMKIQLHIDDELPLVLKTDVKKLTDIVRNLIGNAIKYGIKGTTVKINLKFKGDHLSIEVCNAGAPIPLEKRASLFDPYVTSKYDRRTEGSGLGLFIAQNTAKTLGGLIWLDNSVPDQIVFTLDIPLLEGKADEIKPEPPSFDLNCDHMKVLVVDDNILTRVLLKRTLNLMGCEACVAADVDEAITEIQKQEFDLIFTDLHMQGKDGYDLLDFLTERSELKSIPVIVVSGDQEKGTIDSITKYKIVKGTLSKPFNNDQLRVHLRDNRPASKILVRVG